MKLIFVDKYKKDIVIATVQSDIIPIGGKFVNTHVVLNGKRYGVSGSTTIDYDNNSVTIKVYKD